jgi:hypothetical protein
MADKPHVTTVPAREHPVEVAVNAVHEAEARLEDVLATRRESVMPVPVGSVVALWFQSNSPIRFVGSLASNGCDTSIPEES